MDNDTHATFEHKCTKTKRDLYIEVIIEMRKIRITSGDAQGGMSKAGVLVVFGGNW